MVSDEMLEIAKEVWNYMNRNKGENMEKLQYLSVSFGTNHRDTLEKQSVLSKA